MLVKLQDLLTKGLHMRQVFLRQELQIENHRRSHLLEPQLRIDWDFEQERRRERHVDLWLRVGESGYLAVR